jgi:hypothetical protein
MKLTIKSDPMHVPWYKKPLWLLFVIAFVFLSYVASILYLHWSDPEWCSPWLRKDVCQAQRAQDQLDRGMYPTPSRTSTPDKTSEEQE